jgi:hypothetical protein
MSSALLKMSFASCSTRNSFDVDTEEAADNASSSARSCATCASPALSPDSRSHTSACSISPAPGRGCRGPRGCAPAAWRRRPPARDAQVAEQCLGALQVVGRPVGDPALRGAALQGVRRAELERAGELEAVAQLLERGLRRAQVGERGVVVALDQADEAGDPARDRELGHVAGGAREMLGARGGRVRPLDVADSSSTSAKPRGDFVGDVAFGREALRLDERGLERGLRLDQVAAVESGLALELPPQHPLARMIALLEQDAGAVELAAAASNSRRRTCRRPSARRVRHFGQLVGDLELDLQRAPEALRGEVELAQAEAHDSEVLRVVGDVEVVAHLLGEPQRLLERARGLAPLAGVLVDEAEVAVRAGHVADVLDAAEAGERAGERIERRGIVARAQRGDALRLLDHAELDVLVRRSEDAEGGAGVARARAVGARGDMAACDAAGDQPVERGIAQGPCSRARFGELGQRAVIAPLPMIAFGQLDEESGPRGPIVGANLVERDGIVIPRRVELVGCLTEISELFLPKRRVLRGVQGGGIRGVGFCTERSSASPGDGLEAGDRSRAAKCGGAPPRGGPRSFDERYRPGRPSNELSNCCTNIHCAACAGVDGRATTSVELMFPLVEDGAVEERGPVSFGLSGSPHVPPPPDDAA